jgi:hypothetical protein
MDPVGDGRQALLRKARIWFVPIATVTLIGAILGWLSVPNAIAGLDTPAEHAKVALASAAAAGVASIWAARVRPIWSLKASRRLFLGTFLLGAIGLVMAGTTLYFSSGSSVGAVIFAAPVGLPFLPWLVAGTALWSAAMRLVGTFTSGEPSPRGLFGPRVRAVGLLGLIVVLVVATVAFAGTPLRRLGTTFPEAPQAHRPTVAGIIATVTKDSSEGPITLEDGRTIARPLDGTNLGHAPSTGVGDLYLRGDGWFIDLPPDCGASGMVPARDRGTTSLSRTGSSSQRSRTFRAKSSPSPTWTS